MGKIISITNQKGGVGKTTTAINISASIAVAEKRVLLVDLDPQGNATSGCGIERDSLNGTTYDIFTRNKKTAELILPTDLKFFKIIPSNIDLIGAEVELIDMPGREYILKEALQSVKEDFDYIILDCPPSLGLLTVNALTAADSVIIPVQCEYFAMEGLTQVMKTISLVQQTLNPSLYIEGILLTMFDVRNNLSHQVADEIRNHFKHRVFRNVIPRNVALGEAPSYGKPIILYNLQSKGAQAYLALAMEVLRNDKKGPW